MLSVPRKTPAPSIPKKPRRLPLEARALAEGFARIAGVDEAGRGPWAGPVVAAAVILTTCRALKVRIDDSKRLSPRQRLLAYHAITAHAFVGVGIVSAQAIDAHNIRRATLQAMAQAVDDLGCEPQLVLVDGVDRPPLRVPCRPIVGGDRLSYPIACASIVAKVTRDSLMGFYHRLFPDYRFDSHKGYGTALHLEALKRCGPSILHRLSFQPVSSINFASRNLFKSGRAARGKGARREPGAYQGVGSEACSSAARPNNIPRPWLWDVIFSP